MLLFAKYAIRMFGLSAVGATDIDKSGDVKVSA
jgi:hypothetical protein